MHVPVTVEQIERNGHSAHLIWLNFISEKHKGNREEYPICSLSLANFNRIISSLICYRLFLLIIHSTFKKVNESKELYKFHLHLRCRWVIQSIKHRMDNPKQATNRLQFHSEKTKQLRHCQQYVVSNLILWKCAHATPSVQLSCEPSARHFGLVW